MNRQPGGVGLGVLLLAIWLLLWGSVSVANVVSGLAVVALVLLAIPDVHLRVGRPVLRPVWAARLAGRILIDLVGANAMLTREVVSPGSSINTGIVAVPLPPCSDALLTLIANVLALSPGTMPVEVSRQPQVIYVHVLHLHDIEAVRRDIARLAELAVRAFGSAEAVDALRRADTGTGEAEVR